MCVFQDQSFKMGFFQPSQGLIVEVRQRGGMSTWLENPKDPYLPNAKLFSRKLFFFESGKCENFHLQIKSKLCLLY